MNDEPDVGPVDTHPERHGRHDDVRVFVEERVLMPVPRLIIQAGVIRQCGIAGVTKVLGKMCDRVAAEAVDDTALVRGEVAAADVGVSRRAAADVAGAVRAGDGEGVAALGRRPKRAG